MTKDLSIDYCTFTRKTIAFSNIVFVLGGPGCGKGTQCALIAKEFQYTHISAGDLLRTEVASGSDLGQEIDLCIREGNIVPMAITIRLLKESMESAPSSNGFLIDGFPRELDQAEAFENEIAPCKFVLYFECDESILEKRLLKRGETSGRTDDNIDSIKKRFKTFLNTSYLAIEHYIKKNKCFTISSKETVDKVYEEARKHFVSKIKFHDNIIFVLGGPGSGKGTQCEKLAKEFNLVHISTGDLLRKEVENGTDIGEYASEIMKQGKMVPMQLVLELLKSAIKSQMDCNGFLIDGFPRTLEQAVIFENIVGPCRAAIYFECPLDILKSRILSRGKSSGRNDDCLEVITQRLVAFQEQSLDVIDYFKFKGKIQEVSAEDSIDTVYEKVRLHFLPPNLLDMSNIIFVLGAPGSGKGTQCELLSKKFGYAHISTGDLLREEVRLQTTIGKLAASAMEKGAMVSTDLMMKILTKALLEKKNYPGILVDGFPRTIDQCLEFERVIGKPTFILYFQCSLEILESRLIERGKTSGRADDNHDIIRLRFRTFELDSLPVIQFYQEKHKIIQISSASSKERVFNIAQKYFFPLPFEGKQIVCIIGGPGSGKSSVAKEISKKGYSYICISDLISNELKAGLNSGASISDMMKKGLPVPMEIVMYLLEKEMERCNNGTGFVLDGFPLTIGQLETFEIMIGKVQAIIHLEAPNTILTQRILDHTDAKYSDAKIRVTSYLKSLKVLTEHYKKDFRFEKISAIENLETVKGDIFSRIPFTN